MRSREIEKYKSTLLLTPRQREILVGVLLGDGHLERLTQKLARLKIEHSLKQKEYVDWLYQELRNWVRSKPRIKRTVSFGKNHLNYGFCTYGHCLLGGFHEIFYHGRIKVMPLKISEMITPLGLAVWYMDDGSIKSKRHKGIFLNTQAFTIEDIGRLQQVLKENFFIQSTTRKDRTGFQIYIGGENGKKFIDLIRPFVLPSMFYKIPRVLI